MKGRDRIVMMGLVVVVILVAVDLAIVGPSKLWDAARLEPTVHITPVLLALSWLLVMNAIISRSAVFIATSRSSCMPMEM